MWNGHGTEYERVRQDGRQGRPQSVEGCRGLETRGTAGTGCQRDTLVDIDGVVVVAHLAKAR